MPPKKNEYMEIVFRFDEIAKDKIFASIDRIKGMKAIIKSSYINLKNRLGRVPYLIDFYENSNFYH